MSGIGEFHAPSAVKQQADTCEHTGARGRLLLSLEGLEQLRGAADKSPIALQSSKYYGQAPNRVWNTGSLR